MIRMTEEEWLKGRDPALMLSVAERQGAGERTLLLFACACCRRFPVADRVGTSRRAIEVAEQYADRLATLQDVKASWVAAKDAPWAAPWEGEFEDDWGSRWAAAWRA